MGSVQVGVAREPAPARRLGAWFRSLLALPTIAWVGLFFAVKTMSPGYLDPMFHGSGLIALIGAAVSVSIGIGMIMRMVKIDI